MSEDYIRLYNASTEANAAFFLNEGSVYFFASTEDKYVITGKNLIVGATEIIMKRLMNIDTGRIETAVTNKTSTVKHMTADKFMEGMEKFSFLLNVAMVLARQVLLTNGIINRNLQSLSGEENRERDACIEYYRIVERLRDEFARRKLPWIKTLVQETESSLTFKRGEALCKSSEPVRLNASTAISDCDVEYPRGAVICEEGTTGAEMYILKSGTVAVSIAGNQVATIDEAGTVIGEMALLLGEKRSATLTAKNNVLITKISKNDLKSVAERDPAMITGLAISLAQRHYYNVVKIGSINRSIAEQAIDGEAGAKNPLSAHRPARDLTMLKSRVEDVVSEKRVDYLKDLVDGF